MEPQHMSPEYHMEAAHPGVELNSYSKRTASEDGKYVVIVEHKEKMELIKQPPTPEELAHQRKIETIGMYLLGGVLVVGGVLFGWALYEQDKEYRRQQRVAEEEARLSEDK